MCRNSMYRSCSVAPSVGDAEVGSPVPPVNGGSEISSNTFWWQ
jgi:hypothetical protein